MIIDGEEVNLPKCKICNCEITFKKMVFYNGSSGCRPVCKECYLSGKDNTEVSGGRGPKRYKFINGILEKPCKVCGCELTKENTYFVYGRPRSICKPCQLIQTRDWHRNDKKNRPDILHVYEKNRNLRIGYGISLEEYNELFVRQGGKCAICRQPPTGKYLHVDHDHKTGKVRSLLCVNCNLTLGNAKESIEILRRCIAYLEKHNEPEEFEYYHDGFVHSFI